MAFIKQVEYSGVNFLGSEQTEPISILTRKRLTASCNLSNNI